jgi:hypothetical protein
LCIPTFDDLTFRGIFDINLSAHAKGKARNQTLEFLDQHSGDSFTTISHYSKIVRTFNFLLTHHTIGKLHIVDCSASDRIAVAKPCVIVGIPKHFLPGRINTSAQEVSQPLRIVLRRLVSDQSSSVGLSQIWEDYAHPMKA